MLLCCIQLNTEKKLWDTPFHSRCSPAYFNESRLSGKVEAEELAMSPEDDEVVIQNNRPAKRSTFELDRATLTANSLLTAISAAVKMA